MIRNWIVIAAFVALAPPAFACAELEHASPRVGAVVKTPPREIALDMSEKLDPKDALIRIDGQPDAVKATVVSDRRMRAQLTKTLTPGIYHVEWQVYSMDGHVALGDYKFEVRP